MVLFALNLHIHSNAPRVPFLGFRLLLLLLPAYLSIDRSSKRFHSIPIVWTCDSARRRLCRKVEICITSRSCIV
ncbi:hypothetical protein NL676_005541 [Syzygium grande]|nr:hypothetical protein NL676_005541 [Syzygium grande]